MRVLWIIVGVLTLAGAAVSVARLLHVRAVRYSAAAVLPVVLLLAGIGVQRLTQHPAAPGTVITGKLVAVRWPEPTTSKVIYLTFDDGPDPVSTPYILSVLMANHVPAAFFDIGKNILRDPGEALIKEEVQDGMIVGDHTWSHPHFPAVSDAEQESQVMEDANLIQQVTGVRPVYLRYPYGQKTAYTESRLASWGFEPSVYWTYAANDWYPLCPGVKVITERALAGARPGAVLLLHDSSLCGFQQLSYLPAVIKDLKAKGYQFGLLRPGTYPHTPARATKGD